MSGWDLRDAFRNWALEQVESDCIGFYSPETQSYDRARFCVFGAKYSPEIQGENMQELKPIWTAHVNDKCGFNVPDSFKNSLSVASHLSP